MKVSDRDVLYVAELANLELTSEEQARMLRDLNSILEYMDRLSRLDTEGVPPMAQVSYSDAQERGPERFRHALRQDELHGLRPPLGREGAMPNAPESDGAHFKVPKVIEK